MSALFGRSSGPQPPLSGSSFRRENAIVLDSKYEDIDFDRFLSNVTEHWEGF
jgi:hypothetical protein